MHWGQARKLLRLAHRRTGHPRGPSAQEPRTTADRDDVPPSSSVNGRSDAVPRRARSLCIASGKGGTGKSVVTASLSALFGLRGRTLIVDADMGVGNAHILQGVSPELSFVDVVEGRTSVDDVLFPCSDAIDLLSGGSGVSRMAGLSSYEMHLIAAGLEKLERNYDYLVVDSAAGVSAQTVAFATACDCVLLVTTPDLTAMTDAYAFLKVLLGRNPRANVALIVNRVETQEEGQRVSERISGVCNRFLGRAPTLLGCLPDDPAVRRAGNHRRPVVTREPQALISGQLRRLCVRVLEELSRENPVGMGSRLMTESGFSSRFVSQF